MNQPAALITGANKGIGLETARQLGQQGFYIFLSARNKDRGEAAMAGLLAQGISGSFIQMDVSQPESIQQAFDQVKRKFSRLDVLINNAGILLDEHTPLLQVSAVQSLNTLQINTLGPLWVVQTFLPLLKSGSRVIMVSSMSGAYCSDFSTWAPVYAVSKVALNAITRQLAPVLANTGIIINAMCPGWVKTDMGGAGASRSVAQGAETAVWLAAKAPAQLSGKFVRDKKEISW